jgi:hypothetical protein
VWRRARRHQTHLRSLAQILQHPADSLQEFLDLAREL